MRLRLNTGIVLITVCGLACGADPNLLPNGDFSAINQAAGWTTVSGQVQWTIDDYTNDPNSGSLELNMNEIVPGAQVNSMCFPVVPGAAYIFSGQSHVTFAPSGGLQMSCYAYSDGNCTQYIANLSPLGIQPVGVTWASLTASTGNLPGNARTVQCSVFGTVSLTNGQTLVHVDNLYFASVASPVPVRLQSFYVR